MTYTPPTTVTAHVTSCAAVLWNPEIRDNTLHLYDALLGDRAHRFHNESRVLVGNAIAQQSIADQYHGVSAFQNPAGNGDSFEVGFSLQEGDYTLAILGRSGNDRGKISWRLDGELIEADQDWYSVSTTANVEKNIAVTVKEGKWHVLSGVVSGKNGFSSDYRITLTAFKFSPA